MPRSRARQGLFSFPLISMSLYKARPREHELVGSAREERLHGPPAEAASNRKERARLLPFPCASSQVKPSKRSSRNVFSRACARSCSRRPPRLSCSSDAHAGAPRACARGGPFRGSGLGEERGSFSSSSLAGKQEEKKTDARSFASRPLVRAVLCPCERSSSCAQGPRGFLLPQAERFSSGKRGGERAVKGAERMSLFGEEKKTIRARKEATPKKGRRKRPPSFRRQQQQQASHFKSQPLHQSLPVPR